MPDVQITAHQHRAVHRMAYVVPKGRAKVSVTWYDDGCIRFRIYESPILVREMFLSSKTGKPSIITVAPNPNKEGGEQDGD